MSEKITIQPCPFCGWEDVEIDEVDIGCFAVCCPECECIGPIKYNLDLAIKEWNEAKR